jgi:DnaJ-class molecular chaperone
MPEPSYYQILGVDPQSSEEDIEAAYRSLLAENFTADGSYKPGAKETVEMINRAYVVLTDPVRRKQYDYELFWGKTGAAAPAAANPAAEMQPAVQAEDVPDWLAGLAADEQEEEEQIPAWLSQGARDKAETVEGAARGMRSGRVFIFLMLVFLLLITLAAAFMILTR